MNIFPLDSDFEKAAKLYCDTHCSKIILEIAQMLCIPFHLKGLQAPYKLCHVNHPVSKWVRETYENYLWTIKHGTALYEEKLERTGKGHKSYDVIRWTFSNRHLLNLPSMCITPFAIAINENALCRKDPAFDKSDPVKCYQLYYKYDKKDIAKWTNRDIPDFMN